MFVLYYISRATTPTTRARVHIETFDHFAEAPASVLASARRQNQSSKAASAHVTNQHFFVFSKAAASARRRWRVCCCAKRAASVRIDFGLAIRRQSKVAAKRVSWAPTLEQAKVRVEKQLKLRLFVGKRGASERCLLLLKHAQTTFTNVFLIIEFALTDKHRQMFRSLKQSRARHFKALISISLASKLHPAQLWRKASSA